MRVALAVAAESRKLPEVGVHEAGEISSGTAEVVAAAATVAAVAGADVASGAQLLCDGASETRFGVRLITCRKRTWQMNML